MSQCSLCKYLAKNPLANSYLLYVGYAIAFDQTFGTLDEGDLCEDHINAIETQCIELDKLDL